MVIYTFFANVDVGWINILTVVSTISSLGLSVFAIWFSKKLSAESSKISLVIKQNTEVIRKQTDTVQNHTKILRLENLRGLYQFINELDVKNYWKFRWRFETYDELSAEITSLKGIKVAFITIQVIGFSNMADLSGFDNRNSEFYKVKITKINAYGIEFDYNINDFLACFYSENKIYISKGIDAWTEENKFEFKIQNLGNVRIQAGESNIDNVDVYSRIKD